MFKGQKGITLVALVITIIVMLILAGVSISLALDPENGLFKKARRAGDETTNALNNELETLNTAVNTMENILNKYNVAQ